MFRQDYSVASPGPSRENCGGMSIHELFRDALRQKSATNVVMSGELKGEGGKNRGGGQHEPPTKLTSFRGGKERGTRKVLGP